MTRRAISMGGVWSWSFAAALASACSGGSSSVAALPPAKTNPPKPPATAEDVKRDVLLLGEGPHPGGPPEPTTISVYRETTGKVLLTDDGGAPSWTPDGRIIFTSDRSGSPQIWIMNADGTGAEQLGNIPANMQPVMAQLARNGLIAFMDLSGGAETNVGIWVMQKDGSGLRQLTVGMQPSLALSGEWIAYTYQTDDVYHREIWRIDTDGTNQRQLTFLGDPDYPDANAPNISPDGSTVAFFSGKEADKIGGETQSALTFGHRNVATVPATGGARKTLTPCKPVTTGEELDSTTDCIAADNPAWSPDGRWLIFDVGFKNAGETWMVDVNGESFQRFYSATRGIVRIALTP
jgi:Tol biopolymer transport system component